MRLLQRVLIAACVGVVALTVCVVVLFLFNGDRVSQINAERARNVERACLDVNQRNRDALRELDRLLASRSADVPPDQVARSRANTRALIDALVPRRDCARLAREQVDRNP